MLSHEARNNLQQQKFIWLISLFFYSVSHCLSTIVEIHLAYQPRNAKNKSHSNLQQQKFIWLISLALVTKQVTNLQQQKFIWLISPNKFCFVISKSTIVEIHLAYQPKCNEKCIFFIYNSRNSFGLLASNTIATIIHLSTIVEIHLAYQPINISSFSSSVSTIVEIHLAYQPSHYPVCQFTIYNSRNSFGLLAPDKRGVSEMVNLQQQKFIWLISRTLLALGVIASTIVEIHLAYQPAIWQLPCDISTIVEIHLAYQPYRTHGHRCCIYNSRNSFGLLANMTTMRGTTHLQQQKFIWLISPIQFCIVVTPIYNSRNSFGLLAGYHCVAFQSDLQQQKFIWLISLQRLCLIV